MSDKEFEKGLIVELPDDYEIPYSIIENFILDIGGLSPEKKGTLIMLRRSIGNVKNKETGKLEAKKDGAWPSLNNLAYRVGVSKPTIIKSIEFLEWIKWLTKKGSIKKNGEKGVNTYILNIQSINLTLHHFKERGIKMEDIEEYFNCLYQNKNKGGKEILDKGCIFLSDKYSKEFVDELIKDYKKPPKKKRENKK